MSNLNRALIIGRVGQDPELRGSGTPVCNLSVATSERRKDRNGETREETEWHSVTVFGKQAESCAEHLRKGSLVYIEGRLRTESYTGRDGTEKRKTVIIANTVQFLGGKREQREDEGVDYDY